MMKTTTSRQLRFLPMTFVGAAMALAGASCTGNSDFSDTGSYDDFYAATGSTGAVGEYDNIYDQSGVQGGNANAYQNYDSGAYTDYADNTDYASSSSGGYGTTASAPAPAPTPAPQPTSRARYHVVEKGDTLYALSRSYGTTQTSIQNANGLDGTLIKIGQQLVIPAQ